MLETPAEELRLKEGDSGFRERARKLDEALPPAIQETGGVIVEGKLLGDGVLVTFPSAPPRPPLVAPFAP